MKSLILTAPILLASSTFLAASEYVFGIGQDDLDGQASEAFAIQLEVHSNPLREYRWGSVSGMVAAQVDEDGDAYLGIGLSTFWNTSDKWFIEGSLAAGYYDEGSGGTDLGGNLQFRTLVGFGYRVSDQARISLAVDHLSNAGIEDVNPGREAIWIRYGRSF